MIDLAVLGTIFYVILLVWYSWYMAGKAKKQALATDELVLIRASLLRSEALLKGIAEKNGVVGSVMA